MGGVETSHVTAGSEILRLRSPAGRFAQNDKPGAAVTVFVAASHVSARRSMFVTGYFPHYFLLVDILPRISHDALHKCWII